MEPNDDLEIKLPKIFSKDKTKLYLLIFIILGFFLRIIAAINLTVSADDMVFAVHAINFLGSKKLEVYDQSTSLWYSLTDLFYKIFGVGQVGSRFSSILFGTLSILLIYLLCYEIFKNKRISLLAAFLLAISPFHIKNSLAEMDITVMFFIFLSLYLFIYGMRRKFFLFLSPVSFGLAILTKSYSVIFIPGLFFLGLYFMKKNNFDNKEIIKTIILFSVILFFFVLPTLTYNYLLYKDKKIMDFQFSRHFGKYLPNFDEKKARQLYGWNVGWNAKSDIEGFFFGNSIHLGGSKIPSSLYSFSFLLFGDPIITIFGLFGLVMLFKRKNLYVWIFLAVFLIPFMYIGSIAIMPKHFIFALLALTPSAAYSLNKTYEKLLEKRVKINKIFIILLLFSLIYLGSNKVTLGNFYSVSAIKQMISYKEKIPENALIVADSRIYRGQINWMFHDRNYVEANYFPNVFKISEESPGTKIPIGVYFIECVPDDCGWGTVLGQPEFNETMENIAKFFKNNSEISETIYSSEEKPFYLFFGERKPHFSIYKRTLALNPVVFRVIKNTHVWFLYPIGYDESIQVLFDRYNIYSSFDMLLNKICLMIIRLGLVLALLSVLFLFYIAFKK